MFHKSKAIFLGILLVLGLVVPSFAQNTPVQRLDVLRQKLDSMHRSLSGAISAFKDEDKKKTIYNAQRERLINPEMVISATPSGSNNNNAYANFPTTTRAMTKEPTSNITEPKQAKEKGEKELGPKEYKNIKIKRIIEMRI